MAQVEQPRSVGPPASQNPSEIDGLGGEKPRSGPGRGERRRLYAVIAPLFVLLILWIWLFQGEGAFKGGPGGRAFGADFAMFVTAAQLLSTGQDPYNPQLLYTAERASMHRQRLPMIKDRYRAQVRVGNPPLLYWAMRPLGGLDFQPAAIVWMGMLYVLSAFGFLAALIYFGWTARFTPVIAFLLMPQVVLGAFYGNVIGIVFAGIGAALLLDSRFPVLAGGTLGLAWLKPQIALPVVLLIWLFHTRRRASLGVGFAGATIALFALSLLTTGWDGMVMWVQGLFRYSNDMAIQPDVISLAGLYSKWMPGGPRLALQAVTLGAAVAITATYWKRKRNQRQFLDVAPLWFVWMLASPYGHFFDEIILAIPMVALLGRNGHRVAYGVAAIALYLLFFSLLVLSWTPFRMYLLPVPLAAAGWCVYKAAQDPRFAPTAAEAAVMNMDGAARKARSSGA